MSSPLLVYLLLVCLSLHACNARYLGFVGKETKKQPFSKDAEVAILNMPSILSKVLPQKFDLLSVHRVLVGASTMKQLKDEEPTKASLSGHNLIVSSPYDLKHATKIQGSKKKGRWMLGSEANDAKEAIESKGNEIVEDIEEMDYAQPHRKPPIHNLKP